MNLASKLDVPFRIVSRHEICDVIYYEKSHQHAICATKAFKQDQVISAFSAREIMNEPSFLSVQLDQRKHILLNPEFLQYTNHSCEPNVFFNTTQMQLIALRDIDAGEELTFFYPSTEWEMASPFRCQCGKQKCLKMIHGAANVHPAILKEYKLSDFILSKIKHP